MQIKEDEFSCQLVAVAEKYPKNIFSPGLCALDSEDESFARYFIENSLSLDKKNANLEIVFTKEPTVKIYGHYIRYYNLHKRVGGILREIECKLGTPTIYLSRNFAEGAIISSDERFFLRLQRRELNFYLTHLSILFDDNENTHASFIKEAKNNFSPIIKIPKNDKNSEKATRKLLDKINKKNAKCS